MYVQGGIYDIKEVGAFTYVNGNLFSKNVNKIGRYCSIAPNVVLGHYTHPTNSISHHNVFYGGSEWMNNFHEYHNDVLDMQNLNRKRKPINVGNDVWIGANSFILNSVNIEDGAIIAGGSIVTKDVPPYAIVGGNPARIIRFRYDFKMINRLLHLKWWDYGPEILNDVNLIDIEECVKAIEERKNDVPLYPGKKFVINKVNHEISRYTQS